MSGSHCLISDPDKSIVQIKFHTDDGLKPHVAAEEFAAFADKYSVRNFLFTVILFLSAQVSAGVLLEFGGTYISDSMAIPTTQSSTNYFYNLGVLFNFDKTIWGGWNYSGVTFTNTTTATTTFASQDTGPYVKWRFGRDQVFSMSFAYNLTSKATFSDGTSNENWEGTSYWLQAGVAPEVREGLHIGVSINYYAANYTKKVVSSTESSASNNKTWIFPMLMINKHW